MDASTTADRERSGMTEVTATGEMITLTLSDGETRQAGLLPDGSWCCPWDGTPCVPGQEHYDRRGWDAPCPSPACVAGGWSSLEQVTQVKLEQRRRQEAASQRSWLAKAQEEQREAREKSRRAAVSAFVAEAGESGACVPCWSKSTSHGMFLDRPRVIRHRRADTCPLRRREGAS
jgi:hypothetical protein